MKPKLEKLLVQIFCTKIGWLLICCVLAVIFGSLSSHSTFIDNGPEWCWYAFLICLIYPVVLSIIMIAYGLIINPIKKLLGKDKNK